jgi:hypothetical protein
VQYKESKDGFAAIMNLKKGKSDGGVMNVYKCQFCKNYHIGHAPSFIQKKF